MQRIAFFIYGVVAYVLFFGVYLYLIGFVSNVGVPTLMDGPLQSSPWAVLVNTLIIALFGIQHSVMARPAFKQWWTQFVPKVIERSTYVMISNLLMILLFVYWQPMPQQIWNVESPVLRGILWALNVAGWILVPGASFLINHFDLFGARQVWMHLKGEVAAQLPFRAPVLYRSIRHPLYLGWLMAFWITPSMSVGRLLFSALMTAYILIAIRYEERDLETVFGRAYADYREKVPMLFPTWRQKSAPKPKRETSIIPS